MVPRENATNLIDCKCKEMQGIMSREADTTRSLIKRIYVTPGNLYWPFDEKRETRTSRMIKGKCNEEKM